MGKATEMKAARRAQGRNLVEEDGSQRDTHTKRELEQKSFMDTAYIRG